MNRIEYLLFACAFLFTSCIQEKIAVVESGASATIHLSVSSIQDVSTRGFGEPDNADNAIESFRVLAFTIDGKLAYNELNDISQTSPVKIEIKTGEYHFVFIGNEDHEPNSTLSDQLEGLAIGSSTIQDLESISFPARAFDSSVKIPSSCMVKNVAIIDDDTYSIEGTEESGLWTIQLKRLGVRLDMKISTESAGKKDAFSELHIYNVPSTVPILEQGVSGNKLYNGGEGNYLGTPLIIKAEEGDDGGRFEKPADGELYQWTASRIILPSSVFIPDEEKNGLRLDLHYNNNETVSTVMETGLDGHYQIPRNTHLLLSAVIEPTLEIYLEVEEWTSNLSELPVGMDRTLNVSSFTASLTQGTRHRIWFSSNMPQVSVEARTSTGAEVNEVFKDLYGTDATNHYYEYDVATGTGSGYIDIMTSDHYPYSSNLWKIYLNANGLRREIKVNVTAGGTSTDKVGYFEYVGAFWRNDQVGERVITGHSSGTWEAEVVDGRDWVVIGPGKSTDETIYSANPGDAEDFPVEGDRYYVYGVGEVYFRLGAKSKNPNPGQPRYGRVRVSTYNRSQTAYIYLRQGEEADYLMRPEDYGTSTSTNPDNKAWGSGTDTRPRPLAVKIIPYNLTSPTYFASGSTNFSYREGVFTEYPSQAGTFFYWARPSSSVINAFHPVSPNINSISGWNGSSFENHWSTIMNRQESCPEDYRRPTSGPISSNIQPSSSNSFIKQSEISQSLWGDPTTRIGVGNTLYGYYADGFFDRRRIYDITSYNSTNKRSVVQPNDLRVGFVGVLFFNPNEDINSSIFFPAPGYRHHTSGALYNSGRTGQYWTASKMNSSGHFISIFYSAGTEFMSPKAGTEISLQQQTVTHGAHIRCVRE